MGTLSLLVVPALVLLAAATAARGAAREGDGLLATRSGPDAITSRGSDFWIGFFGNFRTQFGDDVSLSLLVTTNNKVNPVNFTVVYLNVTLRQVAEYGSTTLVSLPSSLQVTATSNSQLGKGIHVTTDNASKLISVFGLNHHQITSDGFLALPSHAYETSGISTFIYFVFSTSTGFLVSRFLIVPTQDNTTISVLPAHSVSFPDGFATNPSPPLGIQAGSTGTMTGQAGQTILIESFDDLTGTIIESDKPISVFTGHECGLVPSALTACDHLVEQVPPHVTWGTVFLTAPLGLRQSGEHYRVGSIYDGTEVTVTCTQQETGVVRILGPATINRGDYFAFNTLGNPLVDSSPVPTIPREDYRPEFCCIQTSEIAIVMGYSLGHSADEISGPGGAQGDPFMMLVPPSTQYLNSYSIPTAQLIHPFSDYISYVIPVQFFDGSPLIQSRVTINGQVFCPESGYFPIHCNGSDGNQTVCGYGAYSAYLSNPASSIALFDGVDGASFQLYVYGFSREVSFGYPAGIELEPIGLPRISCCQENTVVPEGIGTFKLCIQRTSNFQYRTRAVYEILSTSTAVEGADYNIVSYSQQPQLRFRSSDTEPRFNALEFSIEDDDLVEENEQIEIVLRPLMDAFIYPHSRCTVTILDNDTLPGCFFDPISYTVNEADGVVEVTVRNNQPNNAAFQSGACCLVTELLASEASADDFNFTSDCMPVIFEEGSFTKVEPIGIVNDELVESDEAFAMRLLDNGILADLVIPDTKSTASVTIEDDDRFLQCYTDVLCAGPHFGSATIPECCLGDGVSYSVGGVCYNCIVYGWLQAEFQAVESLERFTLTIGAIKGEIKEQLAFTVGHTDGTAEFGVLGDYVFSPNMIIVQDQSSSSVNVTLYTDGIALEEPETFQLTLTPVFTCETSHVVIRDVINVTIIDKDVVFVLFAGAASFSAVESREELRLRVEKTGIVATNFTIEVQLLTVSEAVEIGLDLPDGLPSDDQYSPNRAKDGSDFISDVISVEFSSDEERQQTCPVQDVFVSIIDDDINEADVQYFIARLLPLSVESAVNISAIRTDQPVVLCRIMDDDVITIEFEQDEYTSREDLDAVTVTLTKMNVTTEQTYLLQLMPNTSLSSDFDLDAVGVFAFPPEQQTLNVSIPFVNDDETEGTEVHLARLMSSANGPQLMLVSDKQRAVIVLKDDEAFGCNSSEVSVRLRGGSSIAEGRVEICLGDAWAPLCSRGWTEENAGLVCQQLNFTQGLLEFDGSARGISVDTYIEFNCSATNSTLSSCVLDRLRSVDGCSGYARLSCSECSDGMVSLVEELTDMLYRRVQVCVRGRWTAVCADYWNARDGNVVCGQLESSQQAGYTAVTSETLDPLMRVSFVSRQCEGNEEGLFDCPERNLSVCISGMVAVICEPLTESQRQCNDNSIQIVNGSTNGTGRVEICSDGVWGTVCSHGWDDSDATVACRQLGFLKGGNSSNHSPGAGPMLLSNVNCSGAEGALLDCSNDGVGVHDCIDHSLDAGVTCQECNDGNVTVAEDGRVRFCSNGVLFTICGSTSWTNDEATVVCRQSTDFSSGSAETLSNGTGPVLTGIFACSGDEASLTDCGNVPGFDASNCTAEAAVICSNQGGLPATSVAAIAVAAVVFSALVVMCVVLIVCVTYRATKHKHQRPIRFTLKTVDSGSSKFASHFSQYCEGLSDDLLISQDTLRLLDVIGQGEFGVVYKAHLVSPPSSTLRRMSNYRTVTRQNKQALQVAVKTLHAFFSDKDVAALMDEFLRMKDFDHHNVLTILGVCVDAGAAPYIVMPYMSNGSLLEFVRDNRDAFIITDPLDTNVIFLTTKMISVCLQICKGMEYLASNNVIHRDLAARNCMIGEDWVVKVADFGLSMTAYSNTYTKMKKEADTKLPIKWMAPEAFDLDKFSERSDVWSFGVTCWEVYSGGSTPYPGMNDPKTLVDFIHGGGRLDKPTSITCSDLLMKCMRFCSAVGKRTCRLGQASVSLCRGLRLFWGW